MPTRTASSSPCWRGSSTSRIGLVEPIQKQKPPFSFSFFNGGTLVYLNNSKDHRFCQNALPTDWEVRQRERDHFISRDRFQCLPAILKVSSTVWVVYFPLFRLRLVVIQICIRKTNVALKWLQIYIYTVCIHTFIYIYWYYATCMKTEVWVGHVILCYCSHRSINIHLTQFPPSC